MTKKPDKESKSGTTFIKDGVNVTAFVNKNKMTHSLSDIKKLRGKLISENVVEITPVETKINELVDGYNQLRTQILKEIKEREK